MNYNKKKDNNKKKSEVEMTNVLSDRFSDSESDSDPDSATNSDSEFVVDDENQFDDDDFQDTWGHTKANKDTIIKITFFNCKNGLYISDIELVSIETKNLSTIDSTFLQLDKIIEVIRKLEEKQTLHTIDMQKIVKVIRDLDENALNTIGVSEIIETVTNLKIQENYLSENDSYIKLLQFISSNRQEMYQKIMSLYLVLSDEDTKLMLGEVVKVSDEMKKEDSMLYKLYHSNRNVINNDFCTTNLEIKDLVRLLNSPEIFSYIVKLLIISKELEKFLFTKLDEKKKLYISNHNKNDSDSEITMNAANNILKDEVKKLIDDYEILKNTELELFHEFIEKSHITKMMNISELRGFYVRLKNSIGSYVKNILQYPVGDVNIDRFENDIYNIFKSQQESNSAINIFDIESIKDDILKKINKEVYDNPKFDPSKTSNPIKQDNDLILLKINKIIKKTEKELDIENKKQPGQPKNNAFLVLKKNYLITLFVISYIKMQYNIYDEYMKKNSKIANTMKIEILKNMFNMAEKKMDAIFIEADEVLKQYKEKEIIAASITQIKDEFENIKKELLKLQSSVESNYAQYKVTNEKKTKNASTVKKIKESVGGKHTRKRNRKI